MGGIARTTNGTCTQEGCDRLVEYIGVQEFGDTNYHDLCSNCFLREAHHNLMHAFWAQGGVSDGTTCEYVDCEESADSAVSPLGSQGSIAVCPRHFEVVLLDNVLLDTGWSGRRVEPGWTLTRRMAARLW